MKEAVTPLESIQKDSAAWIKLLAEKKNDDLVSQALLEEHKKSRKDLLNLALLLSFEFWAGVLVLVSEISITNLIDWRLTFGRGFLSQTSLQLILWAAMVSKIMSMCMLQGSFPGCARQFLG